MKQPIQKIEKYCFQEMMVYKFSSIDEIKSYEQFVKLNIMNGNNYLM